MAQMLKRMGINVGFKCAFAGTAADNFKEVSV